MAQREIGVDLRAGGSVRLAIVNSLRAKFGANDLVLPEGAAATWSTSQLKEFFEANAAQQSSTPVEQAAANGGADAQKVDALIETLQQLLVERQPIEGADVVLRLISECGGGGPALLRNFVLSSVSGGDPRAAAELVLAYASWVAVGLSPSDDRRPLTNSDAKPLVEVLPELRPESADAPDGPVIAVVRDVQVLGQLLQQFDLSDVVRSHVGWVERLVLSSAAAQQHGIAVVQDLAELSLPLVTRMLDPRALLWQSRAARFLLSAFPCKWRTVIIVDAPPSFGGLWRAVRNFVPADDIKFLYRPEAAAQLEEIFGRKVL